MRNSKSSIAVVIAERSRRVKGFMAHFAKCGCQQGVFIFGNRSKASVSRPVYSALKISSPNAFMCSEKIGVEPQLRAASRNCAKAWFGGSPC